MTQPRLQMKDAIANDGKIDNTYERQPGMTTDAAAVTDGFHLVIEALKLNGLNTIYGLPLIVVVDLAVIRNCVFHLEPWLRHRRIPCQ